jgi:hypothetical protein
MQRIRESRKVNRSPLGRQGIAEIVHDQRILRKRSGAPFFMPEAAQTRA